MSRVRGFERFEDERDHRHEMKVKEHSIQEALR